MQKYRVGILGATGMVGQQYITLLENHPWFTITHLAASKRSSGKTYAQAVKNRWRMEKPIPPSVKDLTVYNVNEITEAVKNCSLIFSALDSETAKIYEEQHAKEGLGIVSNASTHRHIQDIPLIIPEINSHHLDIIPLQQKRRGWGRGFIVTKPNCSIQSYLTPIFALHQQFTIQRMIVTTMQAVSGSGYPGIPSLDILNNIIPYIDGEEEKSEREPLKILGTIQEDGIVDCQGIQISAHCNRVPVIHGHTACISIKFENKPTKEEILSSWTNFESIPQKLKLPSASKNPLSYENSPDRPQPRLDCNKGQGMVCSLGRLRECHVLDYRFVGLSHNTIRGAAGGAILTAELLAKNNNIAL